MGIDIQKQLDLQPYNDKNVVSKPIEQEAPKAPTTVDEEKSNAAKWMIGATAATAIIIGGLYAARNGHLGKNAENFAKKLFGEGVKELASETKSATPVSTPITGSTGTNPNPIPPALAFITPALVRGKIKNPKFKLNDLIQELEKANISFEKVETTLPIPHIKIKCPTTEGLDVAPWSFRFNRDGVLTTIGKKLSDTERINYRFENNVLRRIERKIQTPSGKPIKHVVEFGEEGKFLGRHLELNEGLKELPVNSETLTRFKSAEIVEAYIPRESKYFEQAVQEFEFVQKETSRFEQDSSISVNNVLKKFSDAHNSPKEAKFLEKSTITSEEITKSIQNLMGKNMNFEAEIVKLIQRDLGEMKNISSDTLIALAKDYSTKLKAHKITNPEHVAIVGKPIKDCSYAEFEEILKEVAPDKVGKLGVVADPFKDRAQEEKTILFTLERLTGRSNINNKMTLLELLQDL